MCDTPDDDAGKICAAGLLTDQQSTCCLSAVTPQRAIINIASAGAKLTKINSWVTLFDDAQDWCCGCSQTSSQHAVSAVTPQRAIINIDSAGGYTNEPAAGVQIHVIHTFDDAGKICAAGPLTDRHQHAVSAVTPQRAIINIASAGSVTQMKQQGTKFCTYTFDDAGKIWLQDCSQTSQHAVSAVTPTAIINMTCAAQCEPQMNQQQGKAKIMHDYTLDDAGRFVLGRSQTSSQHPSRLPQRIINIDICRRQLHK
jgi:hypothetical protein